MNKHKYTNFDEGHTDDYSVLNFLLEHVKGLSPSSLTPEFVAFDSSETIE